jgi:hypothetical protein
VFCNTNGIKNLRGDLAQRAHNCYHKPLVLRALRHFNGQTNMCFAYTKRSDVVGGRPSPKGTQQLSKTLGSMQTQTPQCAKHNVDCIHQGKQNPRGGPSPKGTQQLSKTIGFMHTPTPQWAKHDVLCNTNGSKVLREGRPSPKGAQQHSKTIGFMHTQTPQWAKHNVFCIHQ